MAASSSASEKSAAGSSWWGRNEFLIRRLHSLSGLAPVGAYMVVHLATNASVLNGSGSFQQNVYTIHALGAVLPVVEWGFIFLPILFHAVVGVWIALGGQNNVGQYAHAKNIRYWLQRATGMIAFVFIVWHVFHMHGWFHFAWWIHNVAEPLGGHQFRPYNAASTLGEAMRPGWVVGLYAVGVLACVFHLANGLWTMGVTWGAWTTPAAQRRADYVALGFGVLLTGVSLAALFGAATVDVKAERDREDRMYKSRLESGQLDPSPKKRWRAPQEKKTAATAQAP